MLECSDIVFMYPYLQFQRTQSAIITSLWCRNDVATSFWRHNDVIIASFARWDMARHIIRYQYYTYKLWMYCAVLGFNWTHIFFYLWQYFTTTIFIVFALSVVDVCKPGELFENFHSQMFFYTDLYLLLCDRRRSYKAVRGRWVILYKTCFNEKDEI